MRQLLRVEAPIVLALLFVLTGTASAQTGAIAGQVRDASGGALPGVTVEVTSPALIEKVRSTVTNGNGRYQIQALPVGTYQVTFMLENFGPVRRDNIVVTSDATANVAAELTIGQIKDTVNVIAEAPVVDVQNARVQAVFQGTDIAALPTQRDIPSLLLLVPSLASGQGVCSGGVGIFCNPTAPAFNSHTSALDTDGQNQGRILVDGMVINGGRPGTGINLNTGATNGIVIDTANVQEVSFTLSGSLGESETGGAAINIVPRTGGNRFSGNYFTSYTGTRFFSRNRDTRLSDTPDTQEYNYDYDVTGAFGGPIKRDRMWFYAQARKRGNDQYPNGGTQPGFANKNEGKFGANYEPDRSRGWLTFSNEYKNASVRLTLQATQKNKFNIYWDEQDACTNPCYGMINIVDSPEAYFSLQSRPNRLMQLSWTNPITNRMLFEAGLSVVATHQDTTKHREFTNYRSIPRVCEAGSTVGRDAEAIKVNTSVSNTIGGAGTCNIFTTMNSGSINDQFPAGTYSLTNDDNYRSRASASYITGSHNAKIGYEGVYYSEKIRNEANDLRLAYHYQTPSTTGTGSCLAPANQAANPYACGNMSLYYPEDPFNTRFLRPKPVGFDMNTGVASTDERVWFGAFYVQDQWTLNRFTVNAALRYDHAESRYGETCIGPDVFVPKDAAQPTGSWCSTPSRGVRFNDITPRWGVAWDVFGTGKTSIKWNMGKYLAAAGLSGVYVDNNPARRSTNLLTRGWDDVNGNRIVECDFTSPAAHTHPSGDVCSSLLQTSGPNAGQPSAAFSQFGRAPNPGQLFTPDSFCGRTENSSELHKQYCAAADQNLMSGWGQRRNEWQFGLGLQQELLPRLSAEVTYNRRKYANLTDNDTVGLGCDYYLSANAQTCFNNQLAYQAVNHDFLSVRVPEHPRLPNGGGFLVQGIDNQKVQGALPDLGDVTTVRKELEYSWAGVDTNFVLRARGGLRLSGGTSTGRSQRDTCLTDGDNPNVQASEFTGFRPSCVVHNPLQTNIRANASYTIPWVDVLVGAVFQYRPGVAITTALDVPNTAFMWEPGSANRVNSTCDTNGPQAGGQATNCIFTAIGNPTTQLSNLNILPAGTTYGEGLRLWDLNFTKNIRFANKRLNIGVNVYNLFNSDAATGYEDDFLATYLPGEGRWVDGDLATGAPNEWGRVTSITTPRFMRFTMQFDF